MRMMSEWMQLARNVENDRIRLARESLPSSCSNAKIGVRMEYAMDQQSGAASPSVYRTANAPSPFHFLASLTTRRSNRSERVTAESKRATKHKHTRSG